MLFKKENKQQLEIYLKVTKDVLVPCLNSQINKNFIWATIINPDHINFVKEYLGIDFLSFSNINEFVEYVFKNDVKIQTRHDMDDYMSDTYIDKIQQLYVENIDILKSFLIQAQPVRVDYKSKEEFKMGNYTDKKNSMFLSICQKEVKHHIFERNHGRMYEVESKVITLPEGYTKWIIHGNNISVVKNMIK